MMGKERCFVGFDTSNYTTSCAVATESGEIIGIAQLVHGMIDHPGRPWETQKALLKVQPGRVDVGGDGWIGIARGYEPEFTAKAGAIIGLLHEEEGEIVMARVFRVDENLAGRRLKITPRGDLAAGGVG